MNLKPIISTEELKSLPKDNLVIVDAGSGTSAYDNYLKEHLEGAPYVDLNKDLSEVPENAAFGGRHPLPILENFSEVLMNLGIDKNSHVIIYDDKNAANAAARFWWMLRSVGFEKVQVVDGGFQKLKEAGFQLTNEVPTRRKVEKLQLKEWQLPLVDIDFVESNSENPDFLVIDVREGYRYNGESEPIDEVAGHIPGAQNIFFKENLNEDGTFKNPKTLNEFYQTQFRNIPLENIIVHCGSGVTACHTLLALDYAGFKIPNLYVGSWSEWSRRGKPIAKNS